MLALTSIAEGGTRPPRSAPARAAQAPRETPEERLARGRQAYLRNDFEGTVRAISDLLYPEIALSTEEDVLTAHRLLALSFFLQRNEEKAEAEFITLLQLNPNFSLDAVSDPPAALAFLDKLKKREAMRLEEIENKRREEEERIRREEERRRMEEEARKQRELEDRVRRSIQPVVLEKHSLALAFVPFGAGQLQNGQRAKGYGFFGSQMALGLLSLGLWTALEVRYEGGRILVPTTEWTMARTIQGAYIAAGALFWADVAWGIIDAIVFYKPQVRVPPPGPVPRPAPRASIAPFVGPGGAGLAVGGTF